MIGKSQNNQHGSWKLQVTKLLLKSKTLKLEKMYWSMFFKCVFEGHWESLMCKLENMRKSYVNTIKSLEKYDSFKSETS